MLASQNEDFIQTLTSKIYDAKKKRQYLEIVFLCIGTDRLIGDCFGPLVGTKLEQLLGQYNIFNINIYGSLRRNVMYTNVIEVIHTIERRHPNAYIIVIDAALSQKENIGKIYIKEGKTILGKGLNKKKIEVGNLSIKAVVGKDYKFPKYNFTVLQNVSLHTVITLSDEVAEGIAEVIKYT